MKIKRLLVAIMCGVSVAHNYAHENDELNEKLASKEEQLRTLSQKIQNQEKIVNDNKNKIFELIDVYIEAVKKELKSKKGRELSDQEIRDIANECKENYVSFVNFFSKKEIPDKKFIFSLEFFENCPDEKIDQIAMLKFYVIKQVIDFCNLKELVDQWEDLLFESKRKLLIDETLDSRLL